MLQLALRDEPLHRRLAVPRHYGGEHLLESEPSDRALRLRHA